MRLSNPGPGDLSRALVCAILTASLLLTSCGGGSGSGGGPAVPTTPTQPTPPPASDTDPVVTIQLPATGSTSVLDEPVQFVGVAEDAEDGDLAADSLASRSDSLAGNWLDPPGNA